MGRAEFKADGVVLMTYAGLEQRARRVQRDDKLADVWRCLRQQWLGGSTLILGNAKSGIASV